MNTMINKLVLVIIFSLALNFISSHIIDTNGPNSNETHSLNANKTQNFSITETHNLNANKSRNLNINETNSLFCNKPHNLYYKRINKSSTNDTLIQNSKENYVSKLDNSSIFIFSPVATSDNQNLWKLGEDLIEDLKKQYPHALTDNFDVNIKEEMEYAKQFEDEDYNDDVDTETTYNITMPVQPDDVILRMMLTNLANYLEKSGNKRIKTLAYKVKNLVSPTLYLNHILKKSKYSIELQKCIDRIFVKTISCEMDHQFVLFDMLETSLKIFGKASEEICGLIIDENNATYVTRDQYSGIEEEIGLAVYDQRKNVFEQACELTYVCRRFPSFSEHIAKLLKSITKLSDRYFLIIADVIEDNIVSGADFFRSIMYEEIAKNLTMQFIDMSEHAGKITALMTAVVKRIQLRYKVFYSNGVEITNTTKAIRILIDIIDMTHEVNSENVVTTEFRQMGKVLSEWGIGKKRNMEEILTNFLERTIDFFNTYWTRDIKEEIKCLIEVIVTGSTKMDWLWQQLYTNGSKLYTQEHVVYSEDNNIDAQLKDMFLKVV